MKLFDSKTNEYKAKFRNDSFLFKANDNLKKCIRTSKVPTDFGVYIIYGIISDSKTVIYIGKSGSMRQDGEFLKQSLAKRLSNKQDNKPREQYFNEVIQIHTFDHILIHWFVTFEKTGHTILPTKAEADLVQAYYDDNRCLPRLNNTY